jgi:hypothetical protein
MDDEQEARHETERGNEAPVPKRRMRDRLRKAVHPEPSTGDAADDGPGADAEADQRAIEDEFWKKK